MSEKPKQQTFFIQDPFTEEVRGPLTAQQLKQWYAKGSAEDWGISKSPNGPWIPAAQVKGLAPPSLSLPQSVRPAAESVAPVEREERLQTKQNYLRVDVRLITRVIVGIMLLLAVAGGGYVLMRIRAVTAAIDASAGIARNKPALGADASRPVDNPRKSQADVRIGERYRRKFQDLYDRVKGDLAKVGQVQRRDMSRFAEELKSQAALLPEAEEPALVGLGSKLKYAANELADVAFYFIKQGQAELQLNTSGGPYRVGGMSQETEQMFKALAKASETQIQAKLASVKQLLEEVEKDPLFDQLMQ